MFSRERGEWRPGRRQAERLSRDLVDEVIFERTGLRDPAGEGGPGKRFVAGKMPDAPLAVDHQVKDGVDQMRNIGR